MLSLLLQIPLVLSVTLGAPNPPYLSEDFPGDVAGYHNLAQAFAGNRSVVMDTPPVAKDQRNGNFFLVNQCKYDLYIWEAWKAHQSDPTKVPARSAFREETISRYELPNNHTCMDNCGAPTRSLKLNSSLVAKEGTSCNSSSLRRRV
ncbi:hypothetical protein PMIN02_008928 [Paraphaeosphaeria minitans]